MIFKQLKRVVRNLLAFSLGSFQLYASQLSAVPGEYIVQLKNPDPGSAASLSVQSVNRGFSHLGLQLKKSLSRSTSVFLMKHSALPNVATVSSAQLLRQLRSSPQVAYAEPNYIYRIEMGPRAPTPTPTPTPIPTPPPVNSNPEDILPTVFPNDSRFAGLWGMRNEGQADSTGRKGVVAADIHAVNAWAITKGSKIVTVAVIDSGVDYRHPDLVNNMWSMPGRPDVHGYNAIRDSFDPMDDNEHGTHVAGTIGAEGSNGQGVVGVNWKVSIMAIKFLGADGSGTLANAIKGIDWAREHGAQVMNNSWGGGPFSQALQDAVERARSAGILFVAAAGNTSGGHDNDASPSYPANYNLDNVISVASTNNIDKLSSFSHFGARTVHLAAPGENILSTFPNASFGTISGTSMATPHVAGAAALLLANDPTLTYLQLKSKLLTSVDSVAALKGKVSTGGRLNVYRALTLR